MENPIIKPVVYYTEGDIKRLHAIFKDEEKRLKEKNAFVYLFEQKGFTNDVLKDFLDFLRNYDVSKGTSPKYKDLFFVDGVEQTTVVFSEDLYQLLFKCDRKQLPTYLNNSGLGKFAHWRILTEK